MNESDSHFRLKPNESVPPYLVQISDLLRKSMPDAWDWAASDRLIGEDAETVRLDLLRSTIRLERKSHAELYELADRAAENLGLQSSVTVYQQQNPVGWNASAMWLDSAAHVVLHGPLQKELDLRELLAVLAHELAHVLLNELEENKYAIAHRLLHSLATDPTAATSHVESARLANLFTEVFCDRMAYQVVADVDPVISSLLKIGTQSGEVKSGEYLRQANEVLAADDSASTGSTHPELYVRAKSIESWASQTVDPNGKGPQANRPKANGLGESDHSEVEQFVSQLIQGRQKLESLDLVAQSNLTDLTRSTLDAVFSHQWLRTDAAIAHARMFFEKYQPAEISDQSLRQLAKTVAEASSSIKQYIAYLLLDFATTDRELENAPLAVALDLAERFSISDLFQDSARHELRLRVKQIRDLQLRKEDVIAAAGAGAGGGDRER